MLSTLTVGRLNLGVVEAGAGNPGLEVVQHDPTGNAAEEGKGMGMHGNPGGQLLVKDKLDVLVPAVGQDHDERPGLAQGARDGIHEQPSVAKVHLGFTAGFPLNADGGRGAWGFQLMQKPVDRRLTAVVAPFPETLEDGRSRHLLPIQRVHQLPVGFDTQIVAGGGVGGGSVRASS